MHNALKKWGELEMECNPADETVRHDQLGMFESSEESAVKSEELSMETLLKFWHESFIVEGHASRIEADFKRKEGEEMLQHFYTWWSKEERTVLAIEKGFSCTVDDHVIKGRFDRIEETENGIRIIDYKTGKERSQDEVDADLQLSVYAMAAEQLWEKPVAELSLLFFAEDKLEERHTERNQSQLSDAAKSMQLVISRMEEQDFTPDPSVNKCKHCPYKNVCDVAAV